MWIIIPALTPVKVYRTAIYHNDIFVSQFILLFSNTIITEYGLGIQIHIIICLLATHFCVYEFNGQKIILTDFLNLILPKKLKV